MATTLPVQRHPRSLFPEFSELFAAFPSFAGLRPTFDTRLMRLEDEMKEGRYEVRAELPGVDPDKDVDIMVRDGQRPSRPSAPSRRTSTVARNSRTVPSFARCRCR